MSERIPGPSASPVGPHLQRVLSLGDLFLYGIVAVTPSAPATVFGLADAKSQGHVVVTILAGMVAMVLTAISYGRMASLYPSAGSAYTYVSRGIHPLLGFAAGWAMLLDYVVIPLFCVIYGTLALQRALPWLPFFIGSAIFAGGITLLNLHGIRSTARTNQLLLAAMFTILGAFIIFAVRYLWIRHGAAGLFSTTPFYNPATFSVPRIAHATSFAALTYLGFDAVTTLAEEVKNPRKNVLLAAVGVCIFTGLFGGLLVYLGQLVWPDYTSFPNVATAFIDVTGRVGGPLLLQATALMLVLANIGAGLTSQVGAARLLFGMGRENVLPPRIFARLHPVHNTPDVNVILLGILAFLGAQVLGYELTAEILNFGAFLGFMGVNVAVFWQFWVHRPEGHSRNFITDMVLPLLGFLVCGVIWWGLASPAKLAGAIWLAAGLVVVGMRTHWYRRPLKLPDPAIYE
ncbi:MAG: APC family permease [Terracidiphilus sp.]